MDGFAVGFAYSAIANNVLNKAYGGGAGFYVGTDGAGYYTTKTTYGDGWLGGLGGQVSSFSGSDPGGTTNTFQAELGLGLGFNYDDNYNIGGFQRGFGGIGGGAAFTRERTTATCLFFCKNKSKTAGS